MTTKFLVTEMLGVGLDVVPVVAGDVRCVIVAVLEADVVAGHMHAGTRTRTRTHGRRNGRGRGDGNGS